MHVAKIERDTAGDQLKMQPVVSRRGVVLLEVAHVRRLGFQHDDGIEHAIVVSAMFDGFHPGQIAFLQAVDAMQHFDQQLATVLARAVQESLAGVRPVSRIVRPEHPSRHRLQVVDHLLVGEDVEILAAVAARAQVGLLALQIADRPQVDRLSAHDRGGLPPGANQPVVVRVGLVTI